MERGPGKWRRINVLYECDRMNVYMKNKQKEWHHATKPLIFVCISVSTVGAQSIAHLAQNYASSLNSISGHRCPRELCFFLFERSLIGEEFKVFKKIYIIYMLLS
jgi:hypothetical protein